MHTKKSTGVQAEQKVSSKKPATAPVLRRALLLATFSGPSDCDFQIRAIIRSQFMLDPFDPAACHVPLEFSFPSDVDPGLAESEF